MFFPEDPPSRQNISPQKYSMSRILFHSLTPSPNRNPPELVVLCYEKAIEVLDSLDFFKVLTSFGRASWLSNETEIKRERISERSEIERTSQPSIFAEKCARGIWYFHPRRRETSFILSRCLANSFL